MNRREFAYLSAFAGLAASGARGERTSGQAVKIPSAAGLISEMVFLDDCVRLAMYEPKLSKNAKTVLTSLADYVHNGTLSPVHPSGSPEEYALAVGRVCSKALAEHRQPNSLEARLYQDIAVMHDLAAKAGRNPEKTAPVGDLLDVLHVRRRLGLHTLNPDDNIHPWLEGIVTWWREQHDLRSSLASLYTSPDAAKMREYAAGFYRPTDPVIHLAREFQFGEVTPQDGYGPAMKQAASGSRYARALASALGNISKLPQPTKTIGETK